MYELRDDAARGRAAGPRARAQVVGMPTPAQGARGRNSRAISGLEASPDADGHAREDQHEGEGVGGGYVVIT